MRWGWGGNAGGLCPTHTPPPQPTVVCAQPATHREGGQGTTVSGGSDDQKCLEPNVGTPGGELEGTGSQPTDLQSVPWKIGRDSVPLRRSEANGGLAMDTLLLSF